MESILLGRERRYYLTSELCTNYRKILIWHMNRSKNSITKGQFLGSDSQYKVYYHLVSGCSLWLKYQWGTFNHVPGFQGSTVTPASPSQFTPVSMTGPMRLGNIEDTGPILHIPTYQGGVAAVSLPAKTLSLFHAMPFLQGPGSRKFRK